MASLGGYDVVNQPIGYSGTPGMGGMGPQPIEQPVEHQIAALAQEVTAAAQAKWERDQARQRNVDLARVHADHERSWQVERSETADDVMALIPRLKQAERERDAYRAQVGEEMAARESEQAATTRLAASHHAWVDRATRAESRARALREALEDVNRTYVGLGRCGVCGADWPSDDDEHFQTCPLAVLAAAKDDGPATQSAAPTCKWCQTTVPSWGAVCASCEANLRAHSDLANSDGPGASPPVVHGNQVVLTFNVDDLPEVPITIRSSDGPGAAPSGEA